tara:strand:+ start:81 stop:1325 length:1245 start_codon:yes stop_codon:yes gene_type:complete
MHHFILPTQDSWISSGSLERDKNFGGDEILELKKVFQNDTFEYQSQVLVNFAGDDFTTLSQSVSAGDVPSDAKYYLRLFEAEGTSELSEEYILSAFPLWKSWVEGNGKSNDNPKTTNGVSWKNRNDIINGNSISWSYTEGVKELEVAGDLDLNGIEFSEYHVTFANAGQVFNNVTGSDFLGGNDGDDGGGVWINKAGYIASQSFSSQATDVEMDVTDMVNKWFTGQANNYGMILKFSGSQETSSTTYGHLKFFSRESQTIFQPKLEVRWDSHLPCTGSNTGSLTELDVTGLSDNYLYMRNFKNSYKENDKIKFRVGARKRYIQKSVSTSVQSITDSYITEKSGSYAIKDIATDEFIVPFSEYTYLSCDNSGPYFTQWLNGFYPDRVYKILLKLKTNDGQEQIFDENFKFIVKRK